MSSTEDIGAWLHRARGGVAVAQTSGLVPTRASRADDGSLVAPSFNYWVPWIPIVLITVIAGVIGFQPADGEGGGVFGLMFVGAGGAVIAAAPYLLHRVTHVAVASVAAVAIAQLMVPGVSETLIPAGLLWFIPARIYHRAAYDAEAIQRAADAADWAAEGARIYVILEVVDPVRTDGAKLRLAPAERSLPLTRIVRGLPRDCGPGALIVLDDSGTCLVTMPADMHDRFRHLEETVR